MSTFDELIHAAEQQLWLGFRAAQQLNHMLLRGMSREEAVAEFLGAQLPARFGVTTGEAVDSGERRTGQLDIVIYDRNMTAPLMRRKGGDLLPAEALLAVVEVKSRMTAAEVRKCVRAAARVAQLEPYGKAFVPPRADGRAADEGGSRCMFSVIAFESTIAQRTWSTKEPARLIRIVDEEEGWNLDHIDRFLILGRGLLLPAQGKLRQEAGSGESMLRAWFLHLTSFLVREANRRKPFDFDKYGRTPDQKGWRPMV